MISATEEGDVENLDNVVSDDDFQKGDYFVNPLGDFGPVELICSAMVGI